MRTDSPQFSVGELYLILWNCKNVSYQVTQPIFGSEYNTEVWINKNWAL